MKVGKSMYGWLICLICLALLGDSRALVMQEATNPDVRWFGFSLLRVTNNPQAQRQPDAVPMLRLDKSRFALGESVFFWVGVESKSGAIIPREYQDTCRLTITRPDGTNKTEPVSWPIDGSTDRGWRGGYGLGPDKAQPGRYTLVFEFAGQRTPPATLVIEDVPILRRIKAEFVFSRTSDGFASHDGNVTLIINNWSDHVLRFPRPGDDNSLVSVSLFKSDRSYRSDFFYPAVGFRDPDKRSDTSFDTFGWDIASKVPSVTIRPGETYRQAFPLRAALEEAKKHSFLGPGRYHITFTATLQVLIGEKDEKWSEFCPVRIPVAAAEAFVITR